MSPGQLTRRVPTEKWGHEPLYSDGIHCWVCTLSSRARLEHRASTSSHLPVCHINLPLLLLRNSTDAQVKLAILLYSANIIETLVCQPHQDTVSYFDYSHGNHFRYLQDGGIPHIPGHCHESCPQLCCSSARSTHCKHDRTDIYTLQQSLNDMHTFTFFHLPS